VLGVNKKLELLGAFSIVIVALSLKWKLLSAANLMVANTIALLASIVPDKLVCWRPVDTSRLDSNDGFSTIVPLGVKLVTEPFVLFVVLSTKSMLKSIDR
jgi:hypothetical protein